ncbi:transcriptional regulator [Pantoea stewartii]|uniref:WYL domain-containing protein n=1 Tax=Pantoea stewartii TaxID=66269 RepID=UPI000544397E|nr:WYL domain-containing protein [Pantoea stewartii]KHE01485.1 transcriptional regulator [Pantoea stewartii]KHN63004.1 transcriptional regulator [Pantoea stewartii]
MSAEDRKYDRMAARLALIISRLFMGERLSVHALSQEFMVSERTLRRDFRERLSCLSLDYHQGAWSLSGLNEGVRTDRDILRFARVTSADQLFPVMDSKLISVLTDNSIESPFIVWQVPPERKPSNPASFWRITQAIRDRVLLDVTTTGQLYRWFAPYRLVFFGSCWYLVGEHDHQIQVCVLSDISEVSLTHRRFLRRRSVDELLANADFIKSLPHFQYVKKVLTETATPRSA